MVNAIAYFRLGTCTTIRNTNKHHNNKSSSSEEPKRKRRIVILQRPRKLQLRPRWRWRQCCVVFGLFLLLLLVTLFEPPPAVVVIGWKTEQLIVHHPKILDRKRSSCCLQRKFSPRHEKAKTSEFLGGRFTTWLRFSIIGGNHTNSLCYYASFTTTVLILLPTGA